MDKDPDLLTESPNKSNLAEGTRAKKKPTSKTAICTFFSNADQHPKSPSSEWVQDSTYRSRKSSASRSAPEGKTTQFKSSQKFAYVLRVPRKN
jgi:hypothetical protein